MNHAPRTHPGQPRTAPRTSSSNDITRELRATRPVRRAGRKRPHPAARARRLVATSSLGLTGALVTGFYVVNANPTSTTTTPAQPSELVIDPASVTTAVATTAATVTVAPTLAPTTTAPASTTAVPTTVASTEIATTVAPTTSEATTVAPTTVAPTTVAPTTVAPTTAAPVVAAQPSPPQGQPHQSSQGS